MTFNVDTVVDDMSTMKDQVAADNKRFIDQLTQVNNDFCADQKIMRVDQSKLHKRMNGLEATLKSTIN